MKNWNSEQTINGCKKNNFPQSYAEHAEYPQKNSMVSL